MSDQNQVQDNADLNETPAEVSEVTEATEIPTDQPDSNEGTE